MELTALRAKACAIRHSIVQMIGDQGMTGHLGGSCSCADLMAALYFHTLRVDPDNPHADCRDRFILSKGHAALAQYAALAEKGFFPKESLTSVKQLGSILQGHPDTLFTPGVEANTGSLGQGLSVGLGMALCLRTEAPDARVYVLMGDGELEEGQVWEAARAAAHFRAANLIAVVDINGIKASGETDAAAVPESIGDRWRAFGWETRGIDGHDMAQIVDALAWAGGAREIPRVVLAKTIKGKGVAFAEGKLSFHNASLTPAQLRAAHDSIDQMA